MINALLLVTGGWSSRGIVFAEPLVTSFAGGLRRRPGQTRADGSSGASGASVSHAGGDGRGADGDAELPGPFFVPALAPAMFNVAVIACALGLVPILPTLGMRPITIVAIAVLVGRLGQLAIQWRPLRQEGFRYRPGLDFRRACFACSC